MLNIHQNEENDSNISIEQARDVIKTAKAERLKKIKQNWENKPMHGKYLVWSQSADVDKENTHQWLPIAGLKVETEGFTIAAQDQSRLIRNYQAKIIKNGADSMSALW